MKISRESMRLLLAPLLFTTMMAVFAFSIAPIGAQLPPPPACDGLKCPLMQGPKQPGYCGTRCACNQWEGICVDNTPYLR